MISRQDPSDSVSVNLLLKFSVMFLELDPQNHQEKSLHHLCRGLLQVLWSALLCVLYFLCCCNKGLSSYLPIPCSNGGLCQCGGVRDAHASVALGDYFSTAIVNHWDSAQHSSEYPTDAFGELQFAGASKRHSYVGGLSLWLVVPKEMS